jgi:hypothetical protein
MVRAGVQFEMSVVGAMGVMALWRYGVMGVMDVKGN